LRKEERKELAMAASTLSIAISQANRLIYRKTLNFVEYPVCSISHYGNKKQKRKKFTKRETRSQELSQKPKRILEVEEDDDEGSKKDVTGRKKVNYFDIDGTNV
jgi:hypothetical protein